MGDKFDAVFSNGVLHWCKQDPMGVLESAKAVLKPRGRFVAEMGGFKKCIGEGFHPYVLVRCNCLLNSME